MFIKFKEKVNEIKEVNLLNDKVYSLVMPIQNLISIFFYGNNCLLWYSSNEFTFIDIWFFCRVCNVVFSADCSGRWFVYFLLELSND